MPILFECKSCKKELRAMEYLAGRTLRCPQCMTEFAVPAIGAEGARFIHKEFTWMKTRLAPGQTAPGAAPAPMAETAAAPALEPAGAVPAADPAAADGGGYGMGGLAVAAGVGALAGAGLAAAAMAGSSGSAEAPPAEMGEMPPGDMPMGDMPMEEMPMGDMPMEEMPAAELPSPEMGGPAASLADDPTAPPPPRDTAIGADSPILSSQSVLGEALPEGGDMMAPAEGDAMMMTESAPPMEAVAEMPYDAPPMEEAPADVFTEESPLEAAPPPLDVSLLDEPIPADAFGGDQVSVEQPVEGVMEEQMPIDGGEVVQTGDSFPGEAPADLGGEMMAAAETAPYQQYEFTEDLPALDPNANEPSDNVLEDIPMEDSGSGETSSIF